MDMNELLLPPWQFSNRLSHSACVLWVMVMVAFRAGKQPHCFTAQSDGLVSVLSTQALHAPGLGGGGAALSPQAASVV